MDVPAHPLVEPGRSDQPARRSRWRDAVRRLTTAQDDLHAAEEQEASTRWGGTPCCDLTGRRQATLVGTLRSVTLRPRGGVPALEAELFDGSGTVTVIWLGRREIAGVQAGRRVRVSGMVAVHERRAVMYNPRYELLPLGVTA
ncbi:OB-fold nucleic acid binding domain-containing protein [Thalassiella azotivora]